MITGLAYILTSATLAILLAVGARQRHQFADGLDVFRYPSMFAWTAFAGASFFLLVPFVVYFFATPNRTPTQLYVPIAIFGSIALLMAWACLHLARFYIAVLDDGMEIGGIGAKRAVLFKDVRRTTLVEGGKGGKELSLYGRENDLVLKVSSTIQDFEELLSIIQLRIPTHGVKHEYRDKWGKWSQD